MSIAEAGQTHRSTKPRDGKRVSTKSYFSTLNKNIGFRLETDGMNEEASMDDHTDASHGGEACARWHEKRTTFQRVYNVITGLTTYLTTKTIGERADCSTHYAHRPLPASRTGNR